MLPSS
ncbi:Protein of unknown function [Bacillus toyonensis]